MERSQAAHLLTDWLALVCALVASAASLGSLLTRFRAMLPGAADPLITQTKQNKLNTGTTPPKGRLLRGRHTDRSTTQMKREIAGNRAFRWMCRDLRRHEDRGMLGAVRCVAALLEFGFRPAGHIIRIIDLEPRYTVYSTVRYTFFIFNLVWATNSEVK